MIRSALPTDPSSVARHYDELDRFYRALWGDDLHHGLWVRGDEDPREATAQLTHFVAERAALEEGDRVCDVGCGYGGPARYFTERFGARVVGLTVSEAQLGYALARSREEPRLRFLRRDWLDNRLPDESFEAVVAIESASHMPDIAMFLAEARRVLVPGGRLVVAAWLASEEASAWERRRLLEPICAEGRLAGLATSSEYRRWIHEAGLDLESFDDLSKRVRRTWTICLKRLARSVLTDPAAVRYLLDRKNTERGFVRTVVRIWLAYRTGALRYGVVTARRPFTPAASPASAPRQARPTPP